MFSLSGLKLTTSLGGTGLLIHLSPAPKSGISGLNHRAWLSHNSLSEDINHDVVKDYGTDGEKDVYAMTRMPLHLGSEDKLQVISLLHCGIWRLN